MFVDPRRTAAFCNAMLGAVHTNSGSRSDSQTLSDQRLYAAPKQIDRGVMSPSTRGSMHGEIGRTQFLPKNILAYGTGNLDVAANALNSTANFLKAHGWSAGAGYQTGRSQFRRPYPVSDARDIASFKEPVIGHPVDRSPNGSHGQDDGKSLKAGSKASSGPCCVARRARRQELAGRATRGARAPTTRSLCRNTKFTL
jgi:hypothetical protein